MVSRKYVLQLSVLTQEIERDAMGFDEYHPISHGGTYLSSPEEGGGGLGYMVVDSLDTMQIMGLKDEYNRAREWVANELNFDKRGEFNTFEVSDGIYALALMSDDTCA